MGAPCANHTRISVQVLSLLGRRRPEAPPVPEPVRHAYSHTVLQLLKLPFGTESTGQQLAHTLHLAPEARDMFQQFEAWLEPQLSPFGELGSMTDWAGKLAGAVARLTGILHVADHANVAAPWEMAIGIDNVQQAIRLGEYLIQHARATYAEMGSDPVIADAKYLLAWITREAKTHITKRDAFEGTKGRFRRVEAMEAALRLLTEHSYIRQREPENRAGPGRKPSPTYDVNPVSAYNSPNSQNATLPVLFCESCEFCVESIGANYATIRSPCGPLSRSPPPEDLTVPLVRYSDGRMRPGWREENALGFFYPHQSLPKAERVLPMPTKWR
jgi:Protein of unknown function (DUF3987)